MADTPENNPADNLGERMEADVEFMETHGIADRYVFTSAIFTKATFPHSARGAGSGRITLKNGDITVTMTNTAGGALPYGHYARLVMFWLTREACQRYNDANIPDLAAKRTIPLGKSAQRIMREMGILKPGQRADSRRYKALNTQLESIANTVIYTRHDLTRTQGSGFRTTNSHVADETYFWWERGDKSEDLDNGSYIVLSEAFFTELATHAVPLDAIHIAKIYRSPLALDLYSWAAHRIYTHNGHTRVTWQQLKGQIGTNYPDTDQGLRDFKKKVRTAIQAIADAWPESGIKEWENGVMLTGKTTPVDPKITPPPTEPRF